MVKIGLKDWAIIKAYRHPVMPQVLLNGIISGLPWVMFGALLSLWLDSGGHSRTEIGVFGLLALAYSLNLLWAPLVDNGALFGCESLGRRRSWMLTMQVVILLCLLAVVCLDIEQHIGLLTALMLLIAFAGATQDIAIDAFRIEQTNAIDSASVSAGAAITTIGWWTGYGLGGALSIASLHWLKGYFPDNYWQLSYLILACMVALCIAAILWLQHAFPEAKRSNTRQKKHSPLNLWKIYANPIKSFVRNYGLKYGSVLLATIVLFKLGEAFLGRMSILFYNQHFSKLDIALYSKGLGTITYCVFAFIASFLSIRFGLYRGLLIGGVLMSSTNLLFALLAHFPTKSLFGFAVVADQITTAISTVIFVTFISQLCDRKYAATHYAALASLGNFGRVSLASFSGLAVDSLDGNWSLFFVITALMVVPSLALIIWMRTPINNALATGSQT